MVLAATLSRQSRRRSPPRPRGRTGVDELQAAGRVGGILLSEGASTGNVSHPRAVRVHREDLGAAGPGALEKDLAVGASEGRSAGRSVTSALSHRPNAGTKATADTLRLVFVISHFSWSMTFRYPGTDAAIFVMQSLSLQEHLPRCPLFFGAGSAPHTGERFALSPYRCLDDHEPVTVCIVLPHLPEVGNLYAPYLGVAQASRVEQYLHARDLNTQYM